MKLNNKGVTIVEIIICVTLVSIVLVFLFNVMIAVRNEDASSQSKSTLLINQALIIKDIETDFKDFELQGVNICDRDDINSFTPQSNLVENTSVYCLKFTYNTSLTKDNGYLFYYSYKYASTETLNVVGYRRGDNKIMRETEMTPRSNNGTVKTECSTDETFCSLLINLPIIGDDNQDYGINLSYIYSGKFSYPVITLNDYNFTIIQNHI